MSPDAPSTRASSPEDAPEDPEFAAELARAQANVDRMEAMKQGRKVSVATSDEFVTGELGCSGSLSTPTEHK